VGSRTFQAEPREGFTDKLIPNGRMAVALLLLVNSALFIAISFSGAHALADFGAKFLPAILHGDWYRLITAGYLHVQFLHILMNMMGLFNLGPMVEEIYGTRRMFALYTAATILGFVFSSVWLPRSYSLGASAGIFGLLGALIAFGLHSKSFAAKHLQQQCLLNAAIGFAMGGFMPMIDNAAHLGGLAGGFGIAYLAGLPDNAPAAKEKFWGFVSLVSVLLTLLAFFELWRRIMMYNSLPPGVI
jgi:rhomboid protease GluP